MVIFIGEQVLSMSRLGGAAGAVKPLGADMSPQVIVIMLYFNFRGGF